MKYIKILIVLSFLHLHLSAQQKTQFSRRPEPIPSIKNLKVGDIVPDIMISKIIRNNTSTAKMSDFKDQLLILDFWDTYCVSCIEAFPKLNKLQDKFGDKIKILPVSYQSQKVLTDFFNNSKFIQNQDVKLPCVAEDKVLGSYFQYKLISHVVWIYKGVVTAITGTDYVTDKNIETILEGNRVDWPIKKDVFDFDITRLIFAQNDPEQYNKVGGFLRYSGITGQRVGVDYKGGLTTKYDSLTHVYRTFFLNFSIVSAFNMITFKIKPRDFVPHPDRLVLEVKDKSKYIFEKDKIDFRSDWNREHAICYELVTQSPMNDEERFEYIFTDLKHLLGVEVKWVKRPLKCLVIVKTREVKDFEALNKTRKRGSRVSISSIPVFFLDQTFKYPPALDETDLNENVVIEDFKSIEDLRKQLQIYGCDIIQETRIIDVMLIKENDYQK